MRHSKRRDEIERLLTEGKRNGLTYAEIAKSAGIARSSLAVWACRLRREARERAQQPGFVELVARESTDVGRIEIALPSGRHITVPMNINRQLLSELVTALESC